MVARNRLASAFVSSRPSLVLATSRSLCHSVEVTAESLCEAGVMAVNVLRKAAWVEDAPGPATRLEIEVREPSREAHRHTSAMGDGPTKSPAERITREHLRQYLPGNNRPGVFTSLGRQFDNTRDDRFTAHNQTCGAVFGFWGLPKQLAIIASKEIEIRRKQNPVQRHYMATVTTWTLCSRRHRATLAFLSNATSMSISVV